MARELYILSGLGADERVFQQLDFSGVSATFIKWIPAQAGETIEDYASRLLSQITTPRPTLLGLSFGGIVAVEIAKQIDTEKIILVSSAKTKHEIPFYYRFAGLLGLQKLLPAWLLKNSNAITYWFFGTNSEFDRKILKQTLADTDPIFLKWAIGQIVRWTNQAPPKNTFHIHGTVDRILPLRFVKYDVTIKNGGHFMVLNKADELDKILEEQL